MRVSPPPDAPACCRRCLIGKRSRSDSSRAHAQVRLTFGPDSTAGNQVHHTRNVKRPAIAALIVIAATGCSSTSTPNTPPTSTASATPTSGASSLTTPSASMSKSSTTATVTDEAETLGQGVGTKIAYYAIAKAAGMNDSAKMDELADGTCSRIKSGKADTVGPWVKDAFQLEGDVAAKVAIAAITSQCPEYKSLVGS